MKLTLGWLKRHLDTEASLEEIAERLTAVGLEVEAVVDRAAALAAFVSARVVEARPHPQRRPAQALHRRQRPRAGSGGVRCAQCAHRHDRGLVAAGTTIPGTGLHLKKARIRGEESNGMLCSEREAGLSDEHEGIIELPADTPLGVPLAEVLGRDDPVIDLGITPNRQDCLGVRGIARDLAAAGMGTLKPLAIEPVAGAFASPIDVVLAAEGVEPAPCPLFVGRYIAA